MSDPFRYYLRVRYHECDSQRVVFNGNYGTYIDTAFTEFLTRMLPGRHQHHVSPPEDDRPILEFQLVRQLIEWKAPARFNDVVEISARCTNVGTTSFTMAYALRIPGRDDPIVTAETVNVVMDGRTWTKHTIGPELRALLERGVPDIVVDHAGHLTRT